MQINQLRLATAHARVAQLVVRRRASLGSSIDDCFMPLRLFVAPARRASSLKFAQDQSLG
jgi:hypothetical protein